MTPYMATIMSTSAAVQKADTVLVNSSAASMIKNIPIPLVAAVVISLIAYLIGHARKYAYFRRCGTNAPDISEEPLRLSVEATILLVFAPSFAVAFFLVSFFGLNGNNLAAVAFSKTCHQAETTLRMNPPSTKTLSVDDYQKVIAVQAKVDKLCG